MSNYKKGMFTKRRRLVIMLAILVVGIGSSLWVYTRHHNKLAPNLAKSPTTKQVQSTKDLQQEAARQLVLGNSNQANVTLDSAIAKTTSKPELAKLYFQKAGIAYQAGKYAQSLEFAQKADSFDPNATIAQLVADSADALGNKIVALQYYKLQLQRMQPIYNQDTQNRIQANINRLETAK